MRVKFCVNGQDVCWETTPSQTLADGLRAHGIKSIRCGCWQGSCGMCTVWVDQKPVLACSILLCRIEGKAVVTVEGVGEKARILADYLVKEGGDQCGYCAPGYIMVILALEKEKESGKLISSEEIEAYLSGNLCRCTGYKSKVRAAVNYLNREIPCICCNADLS